MKVCKIRVEALFKDPPAMEDCPSFLPMPVKLLACISLPPATIASIPVYNFADANANIELENMSTETYYSCCGKSICGGCLYSFKMFHNNEKCPFCKAHENGKTDE